MGAHEAGDEAEAGVVVRYELGVGEEGVVGLVGQGGGVAGGGGAELGRDVDGAVLVSGVEDLVGVVRPVLSQIVLHEEEEEEEGGKTKGERKVGTE